MLPATIVFMVGSYRLTEDIQTSLLYGSCFYIGQQLGRLMTPDSDIDTYSYQDYLAGMLDPYFGFFWHGLWIIYGKYIEHRSWISHSPIISTIIRLLYLSILLSPIIALFQLNLYLQMYFNYFICLFLGICFGDLIHLLLDYTWFRKFAEWIF